MNIELGIGIGGGSLFAPTSSDQLVAYAWASAVSPGVSTSAVIHATVNAVLTNSASSALSPTISSAGNVTVSSVIANSDGNALVPSVAIAGSISINAVIASSNLDSIIPVVSTIRNVSVSGVIANSTASTGVPTVTAGGSVLSYYLQYDAIDDVVTVPHNNSFNFGKNFSISVRAKIPSSLSNGWKILAGKDSWTAGQGWIFFIIKSTSLLEVAFAKAGATEFKKTITMTPDQFYLLEVVGDGTNITLKIDGVSLGSATAPTLVDSTVDMYFGSRHGNTGTGYTDRFAGSMDDIVIVKNGVTSGQWNFNEGSGTTTTDSSGNGNTGTLTGCTWVVA